MATLNNQRVQHMIDDVCIIFSVFHLLFQNVEPVDSHLVSQRQCSERDGIHRLSKDLTWLCLFVFGLIQFRLKSLHVTSLDQDFES